MEGDGKTERGTERGLTDKERAKQTEGTTEWRSDPVKPAAEVISDPATTSKCNFMLLHLDVVHAAMHKWVSGWEYLSHTQKKTLHTE